jgi:hypothetical protein
MIERDPNLVVRAGWVWLLLLLDGGRSFTIPKVGSMEEGRGKWDTTAMITLFSIGIE